MPRSRAVAVQRVAVGDIVADVGDCDDQAETLGAALAIDRVVEVARGFAVDRHQRQSGQIGAALPVGVLHFVRKAPRLPLRGG